MLKRKFSFWEDIKFLRQSGLSRDELREKLVKAFDRDELPRTISSKAFWAFMIEFSLDPTNHPIYHIPKSFFEVLQNVDPRSIPIDDDLEPIDKCFKFFSFSGHPKYKAGFVSSLSLNGTRRVLLLGVEDHGDNALMTDICIDIDDLTTYGQVIEKTRETLPDDLHFICGLINANLYIDSEDPITELLPPAPKLNKTIKRDLLDRDLPWNGGDQPAILVNWFFKHPRVYYIDETTVSGYFRWQPCGPANSKRKLKWINEHIRKYKHD